MNRFALWVSCLAGAVLPLAAPGQEFPSKPLRMIVPFPAGGSADVIARLIANAGAERLGQPVIVENRVGASGRIGSEAVAKAAPDGYTLLLTTPSTHLTAIFLVKNIPYDAIRDFTPITAACDSVSGLAVSNLLPVKNVSELIAYAKQHPGKLTYSSAGVGSSFHLTGELFRQAAGVDIVHVPYKGAAQALNDLIGGTISMTFSTVAAQLPYARGGKIRVIAVLDERRFPVLPDVPSIKEGLPNFERPHAWVGLFGPAALPAPVLRRLNGDFAAGLKSRDVAARFQEVGFIPIGNSSDEFAAQVKAGVAIYGRAVKAAGLKAE